MTAQMVIFETACGCDASSDALALTAQALELLDSDESFQGFAAAHLHMAIDSLGPIRFAGAPSLENH